MTSKYPTILGDRRADYLSLSALGGFLLVTACVLIWGRTGPTPLDAAWNQMMEQIQTPALTSVALFLNVFGGPLVSGLIIPAMLALLLLVRGRFWSTAYLIAASLVSVGLVEVVKMAVGRPRPADIMVNIHSGAFPSGHSANATVIVIVLSLIFASHRWIRYVGFAYVILMMASRTYLHAHWITDTIGGLLLGASVTFVVWTFFRARVLPEEFGPLPTESKESHRERNSDK